MSRVPTGKIVADAVENNHGVGSFNVIQLEHVTAIIGGAQRVQAPVILQISHNAVRYHGDAAPLLSAAIAAAERADTPVAVHLDHVESEELVRVGVELGVDSVMFDASTLPHEHNVARTKEVAQYCHDAGVWIEAELGEVGGKDGVHAPGVRTDPDDAAAFVDATGVDALAVAVGSSHAMLTRDASLDFDLITHLRQQVPVPLVLHGSSGVSDVDIAQAISSGMTKINIATQLNKVFTASVREKLGADEKLVDPRKYLGLGRDAVTAEVARLITVLGAANSVDIS